ncbi:Transcription factor, MADS-box [Dillenia turbinata]|uniref:Transcription factor, MADS-box n=1 Tax=Dillenia turbinata TaxID=194707 RepID=A0AAN8WCS4_9MAGN
MARRLGLGRRKIRIAQIEKRTNLQVTFSKRKLGIFKKASELAILCGVEIAIILFSPGGKVLAFGSPDVQSVISRFRPQIPPPQGPSAALDIVEAKGNVRVHELTMQLDYVSNQLEEEKKRGEALDEAWRTRELKYWWEDPIEELNSQQLQALQASVQDLEKYADYKQMELYQAQIAADQGFNVDGHGPRFFG